MMSDMYDLTGWRKVDCKDSDDLRAVMRPTTVSSSLTDLSCEFTCDGLVYTEWADSNGTPFLRDYRWTHGDRPCEHYENESLLVPPVPTPGPNEQENTP